MHRQRELNQATMQKMRSLMRPPSASMAWWLI